MVVNASGDIVGNIMSMIFDNWWIIAIIAGVGIFLYYFTGLKSKVKVVRRDEIEKNEFKKRLEHCTSSLWRWLYLPDNDIKGQISRIRFFKVADGKMSELQESELVNDGASYKFLKDWGGYKAGDSQKLQDDSQIQKDVLSMLVSQGIAEKIEPAGRKIEGFAQLWMKPLFISGIKIPNFLSGGYPMQLSLDAVELEPGMRGIRLKDGVSFDYFMGINHDMTTMKHVNLINEQILRTDYNLMTSAAFVKAQEMSTFDPEKAHNMAMKQKELEIELARKRGKMSTI